MVTIDGLKQVEDIEECEKLPIANKLWGTVSDITAYGQMGYIEGTEWVVKLTACEKNPLTTYCRDGDPVYKDSALEVFMNFNLDAVYYLNLEVNANGALLGEFGIKGQREPLSVKTDKKVSVSVQKEEEKWSVLLRIPLSLLEDCFGDIKMEKNSEMAFNLYKICETEVAEHYMSYAPVISETPDFHLPFYFAKAILG